MISDEEMQKTWERSHEIGSPNYHLRTRLLRRLIPRDGKGLRALDAGCSTGGATRILLERGYEVYGIDLSPYAVERIEQTLPSEQRTRFVGVVSDLSAYRPDFRYDLIVLSEVLEHIEDDAVALRRVEEWLSADGRVVITVPADPTLWSDADVFSKHYRRYTPERLMDLIEKSGLRAEAFWPYGFPVLWTYTRLKNRLFRVGTLDRVVRARRGSGGVRTAATVLKFLVNLDRLFVGHGRPVGLMVLAAKRPRGPRG
jgi:SAM-dependent methyltransferase